MSAKKTKPAVKNPKQPAAEFYHNGCLNDPGSQMFINRDGSIELVDNGVKRTATLADSVRWFAQKYRGWGVNSDASEEPEPMAKWFESIAKELAR